jgi:hypothetical protein
VWSPYAYANTDADKHTYANSHTNADTDTDLDTSTDTDPDTNTDTNADPDTDPDTNPNHDTIFDAVSYHRHLNAICSIGCFDISSRLDDGPPKQRPWALHNLGRHRPGRLPHRFGLYPS